MLDIFNRKKLAALQAELALVTTDRDYWKRQAEFRKEEWDAGWRLAKEAGTGAEVLRSQLTAIKEKQRENSRKGGFARAAKLAKRRA